MKKLIALFLVLSFAAAFPLASGEENFPALSEMTLDELQSLNDAILSEIDSRFGSANSRIGSGYFVVGAGILPGTYDLSDIKVSNDYGRITLYNAEGQLIESFYVYNDSIFTVTLTEGITMEIERVISACVAKSNAVWNAE